MRNLNMSAYKGNPGRSGDLIDTPCPPDSNGGTMSVKASFKRLKKYMIKEAALQQEYEKIQESLKKESGNDDGFSIAVYEDCGKILFDLDQEYKNGCRIFLNVDDAKFLYDYLSEIFESEAQ